MAHGTPHAYDSWYVHKRFGSCASDRIRKNMAAGFRLGSGTAQIRAYLATLNPGGLCQERNAGELLCQHPHTDVARREAEFNKLPPPPFHVF